mmetsp:Transcript_25191/g.81451  ORF Transcript_25191/g.81451 Transcript_25191/m.81451 type:complete len:278 (+) Transcript_25191:1630-2463(+)
MATSVRTGEVLDGTRDADGDVEVRGDDLASLSDLLFVADHAGVDGGARGADGGGVAELGGEVVEHGEVVAGLHPAAPRDDDLGRREVRLLLSRGGGVLAVGDDRRREGILRNVGDFVGRDGLPSSVDQIRCLLEGGGSHGADHDGARRPDGGNGIPGVHRPQKGRLVDDADDVRHGRRVEGGGDARHQSLRRARHRRQDVRVAPLLREGGEGLRRRPRRTRQHLGDALDLGRDPTRHQQRHITDRLRRRHRRQRTRAHRAPPIVLRHHQAAREPTPS